MDYVFVQEVISQVYLDDIIQIQVDYLNEPHLNGIDDVSDEDLHVYEEKDIEENGKDYLDVIEVKVNGNNIT